MVTVTEGERGSRSELEGGNGERGARDGGEERMERI